MKSSIVFTGVISMLFFISGCSSAGPFVSSISSDGKGNIIIEKQKVEYNMLLGTVSTEDLSTQTIKVCDIEK